MAIHYTCRYCRIELGQIEEHMDDIRLGFHQLTPDQLRDIITYDLSGQTEVRVVCETCQEMLELHPELSLLPNPLQ
ncbi:anti-sigma-F factor Fin family protein [Mechercharimyces sp. CAU 1602]|uniref:anti-sigma-F factor Fin family protein n=1 Tax=Mechercharimyces sp. CAU 1602 TaxID=2973933 RepID=UPI002163D8B5|nr:anti-sigma-F factor Fin family protein [Mechercharimyces sp. CAU 1602]MCS1352380.1 anti-sigma-F factor Fin family protein [Mechercharimyces sp. CAU 1602]